ncbi:MAG: N-6 DNA methylase [Sandaracinaceae bacterium]
MSEQLDLMKEAQPSSPETPESIAVEEGKLLDYITGKLIKDSAKEQVRQRVARALFHEYGISVDDMEPSFRMTVDGRSKKADIAIFEPDSEHTVENLIRVVLCEKEPKPSKKGATKIRDHEQAKKDVSNLHAFMGEGEKCRYGLWTNGLEFFFFEKKVTRFDVKYEPLGDWPPADESVGSRDVVSNARMRQADPDMLRVTFRRCHNFIHGNEGLPKDAAFWQFLYLIFAKIHDESKPGAGREFWAGPTEQFTADGREAIKARVLPLFDEVKAKYPNIFRGEERLSLSDRALAFMVSELAKYDLARTAVDAKGAAYQEIVGSNLRGDKGQFFTPRSVINMAVAMLDPKPNERFMDPACGTGGFLVAAIDHIDEQYCREHGIDRSKKTEKQQQEVLRLQREFAAKHLFGSDFDPYLVKAAQMNIHLASDADPKVFHVNSLELPAGHLDDVEAANAAVPMGTIDVIATNPPFGSKIPVTDPLILEHYDLGHSWKEQDDGVFVKQAGLQSSVAPEVLFIERVVQLLRPRGRAALVLPNGLLSNASDAFIRAWIMRHTQVLASVDLPMETFIPDANVNILTSVLFIRKRTEQEMLARDLGNEDEEKVFFAVAERIGYDRRGLPLFERSPEGKVLFIEEREREQIRIRGKLVERELVRMKPTPDDDLPRIVDAWRRYQKNGHLRTEAQ